MGKIATTAYVDMFEREIAPHIPFDCLGWLAVKGFFKVPASTKYHGSHEGGLFEHSLAVMEQLVELTKRNHLEWQRPESPYVVGIFHDLCKMDSYTPNENRKAGEPPYLYNTDTLLKGHGEKSVMLLSTLTKLTEEEVACIRYHMGAFTDKEEWSDYTRAIHRFPNVLWTHHADMIATHILDL